MIEFNACPEVCSPAARVGDQLQSRIANRSQAQLLHNHREGRVDLRAFLLRSDVGHFVAPRNVDAASANVQTPLCGHRLVLVVGDVYQVVFGAVIAFPICATPVAYPQPKSPPWPGSSSSTAFWKQFETRSS